MNTPSRDARPGGYGVELEQSRDIEDDWNHRNVVNSARYEGKCPKSDKHERNINTNVQ
jgi:hypothetical protein